MRKKSLPAEISKDPLDVFASGSTETVLKGAGEVLRGGAPIGYAEISDWMRINQGRVRSAHYVRLFAEAAVANVPIEFVDQQFPDARRLAKSLGDHMKKNHPGFMKWLSSQYGTADSAYKTSSPTRSSKGLPTDQRQITKAGIRSLSTPKK